jgi:hypothetical protein
VGLALDFEVLLTRLSLVTPSLLVRLPEPEAALPSVPALRVGLADAPERRCDPHLTPKRFVAVFVNCRNELQTSIAIPIRT